MNRVCAVKELIRRHEQKAILYGHMSEQSMQRAKELKSYLYELGKPGFKTAGWKRFTGMSRIEPYVVQAPDGYQSTTDWTIK